MRKLLSGGLILVGVVALPAGISVRQSHYTRKPDYLPGPDPRLASLERFFQKASCPAVEFVSDFVETADTYALDWRLLPSISYVESTGGKAALNNNLFGWDSGRAQFSSFADGIREVGYQLSHSALYRNKNTDGILATYNSNAEYAAKVKFVMRSIAVTE